MNIDTTFCDLVRTESSGKHLLVGVYPNDFMVVSQIPGTVHVSAWTKVRDLPAGAYNFEMTFLPPKPTLVSPEPFSGSVNVRNSAMPAIIYSGYPALITLSDEGFVTVRLKLTNAAQQVVCDQIVGSIFIGRQT